jgi:hypothetical protein
LSNLTAAVAAGGDVPALVAAIRAREAQRCTLLDRLVQTSEPVELDSRAVMADLRARLEDWRELLREETPHARGLLKQLIVGRVLMEPDRERVCYRFRGTGTLLPLVEESDPIARFLADCCVLDEKARTTFTPLFERYLSWSVTTREVRLNRSDFIAALHQRFERKATHDATVYVGVRLCD